MLTSFSFYFYSRLTAPHAVWHSFGCFILHLVYFILCYFLSTHFHDVHPTLWILCSEFLHPVFGSQCCKNTLTEPPPAPKTHVHSSVGLRQNPFLGQRLKMKKLRLKVVNSTRTKYSKLIDCEDLYREKSLSGGIIILVLGSVDTAGLSQRNYYRQVRACDIMI